MRNLIWLSMPKFYSLLWVKGNDYYDALFYPVEAGDKAHIKELQRAKEGGFIVVEENKAPLVCNSVEELDSDGEVLVVPGVGSSSLGAAAFAREVLENMASFDPNIRKVMGVVVGYGSDDIVSEGMEGWFNFSHPERMSQLYDHMVKVGNASNPYANLFSMKTFFQNQRNDFQQGCLEVSNIIKLLSKQNIKYIVAHSKGSLVTALALEKYAEIEASGTGKTKLSALTVITLGAVSEMPTSLKGCFQFLGDNDHLGEVNSSFGEPYIVLKNTGHSLSKKSQTAEYCHGCKHRNAKYLCYSQHHFASWLGLFQGKAFDLNPPCSLFEKDESCKPIEIEKVFKSIGYLSLAEAALSS
ncbi:hypothetical protein [Thaumasiovibrio subtropicus]|uniref:hypothetical protein n=1 Tax=Thaumasiovibrio subtropicus TaxID=1891207 RepID=UPI000B34AAE1|nr:hypothetical protein [Thaumasiovibrio subtropicus]